MLTIHPYLVHLAIGAGTTQDLSDMRVGHIDPVLANGYTCIQLKRQSGQLFTFVVACNSSDFRI